MAESSLAIEATGLRKSYRRGLRGRFQASTAVAGIDLAIPEGTVHGLLGPNGAGKTTSIHMILGITRPNGGSVRVLGGSPRDAAVRSRIGYVPEKFELPPFLTARKFLELHVRLHGGIAADQREREIERVLDRLSLTARRNDLVSAFSKGMQQRLAIAQALLGSPRLVVLDEPTSALDPVGRRDVRDLILDLRADGATVLLNSHLLSEVEQVCDDVAILRHGRVVDHRDTSAHEQVDRLRLTARIDGLTDELQRQLREFVADMVLLDDASDGPVELVGSISTEDVPRLASTIVAGNAQLLQLRTDDESLEDVFLRVVDDRPEAAA